MQLSNVKSLLSLVAVFIAFQATADVGSKLSVVKVKNVFIPVGFDDNDEAVVVLDGYLPDTCYKLAGVEVKRENNAITVIQNAREYTGNCFDVTVPFTNVVKLGVLEKGDFSVTVNESAEKNLLTVKAATHASPDDYLYAPIDMARVENNKAILHGRFTNTCLKIEDVKIVHTEKTVQVLPVMRLQSEGEAGHPCEVAEVEFEHPVDLTAVGSLPKERHLLHVRSLDGQSVNVVFSQK